MIDATTTDVKVTSSSNRGDLQPEDALDGPEDTYWEPSDEDENPYLEFTPNYVGDEPKIDVVHVRVVSVERVVISYVTPEGTIEETEPVRSF